MIPYAIISALFLLVLIPLIWHKVIFVYGIPVFLLYMGAILSFVAFVFYNERKKKRKFHH